MERVCLLYDPKSHDKAQGDEFQQLSFPHYRRIRRPKVFRMRAYLTVLLPHIFAGNIYIFCRRQYRVHSYASNWKHQGTSGDGWRLRAKPSPDDLGSFSMTTRGHVLLGQAIPHPNALLPFMASNDARERGLTDIIELI